MALLRRPRGDFAVPSALAAAETTRSVEDCANLFTWAAAVASAVASAAAGVGVVHQQHGNSRAFENPREVLRLTDVLRNHGSYDESPDSNTHDIREIVRRYDNDGDYRLSRSELNTALSDQGFDLTITEDVFEAMDTGERANMFGSGASVYPSQIHDDRLTASEIEAAAENNRLIDNLVIVKEWKTGKYALTIRDKEQFKRDYWEIDRIRQKSEGRHTRDGDLRQDKIFSTLIAGTLGYGTIGMQTKIWLTFPKQFRDACEKDDENLFSEPCIDLLLWSNYWLPVNSVDKSGKTLLMTWLTAKRTHVGNYDHERMVKRMIALGADVNRADNSGNTPLGAACATVRASERLGKNELQIKDDISIVTLLIKAGADITDAVPTRALTEDQVIAQGLEKAVSDLETFHEGEAGKIVPNDDYDCPVCYETLKDKPWIIRRCGHAFCEDCALQFGIKCPMCRREGVEFYSESGRKIYRLQEYTYANLRF